jgi:hypothetical protein
LYPGSISIQIDHALDYCSYVPNPVLVIIDVEPKELGIPTKAYYAVEEVKEVGLKSLIPMIKLLNFYFYLLILLQKRLFCIWTVGEEIVF